jgi:serine/threonine protein kinase
MKKLDSGPMLGRYEVERELGKGAMGIVYLGRELGTGRAVTIKTMALPQEVEPDELDEVKERFFREAGLPREAVLAASPAPAMS